MKKISSILIFLLFSFQLKAEINKDTTLSKNQVFGGFGLSLYGYTEHVNSYISFLYFVGCEYNISKKIKYGFSFNPIKFNWTGLKINEIAIWNGYDKARYYSSSFDYQLFFRYIINRSGDFFNSYDKYLELGIGYNLPYYFSVQKFKDNHKSVETYPNKFIDFYTYGTIYLEKPLNIPLGVRFEYHPIDLIKNKDYPNVSKLKIDLLISLFTPNSDKK